MRGNLNHSIRLAAIAAVCAASLSVPATAQPADTPATILDRCLRTLASDPKDFNSLINAGRAAVKIGDPEAAAGFFARADEVNPRSPYPQAGMGAVSVANGQPQAAMPYFARALQLGATVGSIGADRGLAYDLMGMQAQAQADYRAALSGADGTEARRRLALSLAISGDRAGALQTLAPLAASGDPATSRIRAFILALTGDANAAMVATDAAMPGSWASVAPFLKRLAVLQPGPEGRGGQSRHLPGFEWPGPRLHRSGLSADPCQKRCRRCGPACQHRRSSARSGCGSRSRRSAASCRCRPAGAAAGCPDRLFAPRRSPSGCPAEAGSGRPAGVAATCQRQQSRHLRRRVSSDQIP